MVNSPMTGAAARGGAAGLGDRCRAYAQTGATDPYFAGLVVFVVTTGLYGMANAMEYFKKSGRGINTSFLLQKNLHFLTISDLQEFSYPFYSVLVEYYVFLFFYFELLFSHTNIISHLTHFKKC